MTKCYVCNKGLLFIKHRLRSGNGYICNKCMDNIPIDLIEFTSRYYSREDFLSLFAYMNTDGKHYLDIYTETDKFGDISLDKEHSLFKLSSSLTAYAIKDLKICHFLFEETGQENEMNFILSIESKIPRYKLELILVEKISVDSVSDANVGNDYTSFLPKAAKKFMDNFYMCLSKERNKDFDKALENYKGIVHVDRSSLEEDLLDTSKALLDALKIFNLQSLENVTVKDLQKIKSELLSPSKIININYAGKVNDSFTLLKATVNEMNRSDL